MGSTLNNLQFAHLSGSGQLKLTVQEYLAIATKVSSKIGQAFDLQVEWRPEDAFVTEAWRRWRDAHAQVEIIRGMSDHFPPAFRDLVIIMACKKQGITSPDISANDQ